MKCCGAILASTFFFRADADVTHNVVGSIKRCEPNVWLGKQGSGSIDDCMTKILATPNCNQNFFNHATDGDKNCGCVTKKKTHNGHPYSCVPDSGNQRGADSVYIYEIVRPTPAPEPEPTPEPEPAPTATPSPPATPQPSPTTPPPTPLILPSSQPSASPSPVCTNSKNSKWEEAKCIAECNDPSNCHVKCADRCRETCVCNAEATLPPEPEAQCAAIKKWSDTKCSEKCGASSKCHKKCKYFCNAHCGCNTNTQEPKPAPLPEPAPTPNADDDCEDSSDWVITEPASKAGGGCSAVGEKTEKTELRCRKFRGTLGDKEDVKASKACKLTCGKCSRRLSDILV